MTQTVVKSNAAGINEFTLVNDINGTYSQEDPDFKLVCFNDSLYYNGSGNDLGLYRWRNENNDSTLFLSGERVVELVHAMDHLIVVTEDSIKFSSNGLLFEDIVGIEAFSSASPENMPRVVGSDTSGWFFVYDAFGILRVKRLDFNEVTQKIYLHNEGYSGFQRFRNVIFSEGKIYFFGRNGVADNYELDVFQPYPAFDELVKIVFEVEPGNRPLILDSKSIRGQLILVGYDDINDNYKIWRTNSNLTNPVEIYESPSQPSIGIA